MIYLSQVAYFTKFSNQNVSTLQEKITWAWAIKTATIKVDPNKK